MSLDTVLKIGKALRHSKNRYEHYRYTKSCPKDKDIGSQRPICISIPVKDDFSFDWSRLNFTPENESLYYLNFKTSSDSSPPKYFFGDIYYKRKRVLDINKSGKFKKENKKFKGVTENGNFCFERGIAFENADAKLNEIIISLKQQEAILLIPEHETEKEKEDFCTGLNKFIKNPKWKIVKKLQKYSDEFKKIYQKIDQKTRQLELLKFRDSFKNEFSKIEKFLRYAPAIKSILSNDKERLLEILNNEKQIQEEYIKVIVNNDETKIKKLYKEEETKDNLSEETKNEILKYADFEVFIHFNFNGKHWHEFSKSFELLTNKLNEELTETTEIGVVAKKNIYRTLCSGNDKNDIQFPNFFLENRHKSFLFSKESFNDLLHIEKFFNQPTRYSINGTKLQVFILPCIIDSTEKHFDFIDLAEEYESFLKNKMESSFGFEPLFPMLEESVPKSINKFDVIFAEKGSNTTSDLVEISGLDKSLFFHRKKEIEEIEKSVSIDLAKSINNNSRLNLTIENALMYLKGDILEEEKAKKIIVKVNHKYQSHLLKIVPKIYLNNYFQDESLLHAFICNVESIVRKKESFPIWTNLYLTGDKKGLAFNRNWEKHELLKHCYKLFISIQKSNNMKKITDTENYQIGVSLGKMAQPLRKAIGSFEKSYVGLLTRRISTLEDCLKFKNDLDSKLAIHGKTGFTSQYSTEASEKLASMKLSDYDKEKLAFGFFEGYFKYEARGGITSFISKMEKLLGSYESSEELEDAVNSFTELLEEFRNQSES